MSLSKIDQAPTGSMGARSQSSSPGDLPKLTELLLAVLIEEFHPEQDGFTTIAQSESQADAYSCDYCGRDIFISFFECACPRRASSEENGATSDGDIQLCPGCVAEGRSGACAGPLMPVQRFPYSSVRDGYNNAVRTLRELTGSEEWREIGPTYVSLDPEWSFLS